jgi:hypothetical protein
MNETNYVRKRLKVLASEKKVRAGCVANIAKIDIFLFCDFLNSRTTYVRFFDGSEFYYRAVQIVTYDNVAGQRRQNM